MTPPPSSSLLTSLLNSLHSHLQAQTQLLPTLHAQLGLPSSALEEDLENLEKELRLSVDSQIDARRREVDQWMEKCEEVESVCLRYTKALGGNVKATGNSLGELRKETMLPKRYELVSKFQESLRQMYHAKLEQLTTLTNRLNALSRTLGTQFFPPDVLEPIIATGESTEDINAHRDVTPERFLKLEKELVRGKAEVSKRLNQLSTTFIQIDWLYTELGMPPPPVDDMPPSLTLLASLRSRPLPPSRDSSPDPFASSPTPSGSRLKSRSAFRFNDDLIFPPEQEYQHIFARYVAKLEELEDDTIPENPNSSIPYGLEGVDPSPGLLQWAEDRQATLEETKRRREAHIQDMYDQLEVLWKRMGIDESAMDAFVDMHKGSTEETIREYEEELERMLELKRSRMGTFIESAREEIVKLWDELLIGRDERGDFAPFADDESTEELLSIHEEEIRRLKEEKRLKAPILANIKKYFDVLAEEKELQIAAADGSRLLGRGARAGQLLREEKMRKRVQKEKPRLERELLTLLPAWEQENGQPFLVNGEHFLQALMETVSAAEQENKRRSTRGSSVPPRATTPSGVAPPAATAAPPQQPPAYIPGKPGVVRPNSAMQMLPNKRQKLNDSTPSTSSAAAGQGTRGRGATPTPGGTATTTRRGRRAPPSAQRGSTRMTRSTSSPAKTGGIATRSRTRATPTATPASMVPAPRQVAIPIPKLGTDQHVLGHGRLPVAATQGFLISGSGIGSVAKSGSSGAGAGYLSSSTSTAASRYSSATSSTLKSSTTFSSRPAAGRGVVGAGSPKVVVASLDPAGLAKKASRARRESFRPRPSADTPYDPVGGATKGTGAKEVAGKVLDVVVKEELEDC